MPLTAQHPPSKFWINWLTVVAAGVSIFGLTLVLLPDLASAGFSLLVYADVARISSFGSEAAAYIALAHAVLNAVFLVPFAIPLLATRKSFSGKQA